MTKQPGPDGPVAGDCHFRVARPVIRVSLHTWGPVPSELLEDHLRALAACVVAYGGAPLADVARALGIAIPAVREGILRIADRLEAVGYRVVDDDVTVRLVPFPSAACALEIMGTAERLSELRSEHYELICIVAHLGTAVRSKIEEMFGRDCELLLRRLAERGHLERVTNDRGAVGAPTVYRVTAAAIAATGHSSVASLQRYLADSLGATADVVLEGTAHAAASGDDSLRQTRTR